jgi:hypothetical protein
MKTITLKEAEALLEAATPGPWMHNWRGPEDGAPGDIWHTGGCGGPLTREADWVLATLAPWLATSVVALHGEVERLRGALPPDRRGQGVVGSGGWAVFAERAIAERDALDKELSRLIEALIGPTDLDMDEALRLAHEEIEGLKELLPQNRPRATRATFDWSPLGNANKDSRVKP